MLSAFGLSCIYNLTILSESQLSVPAEIKIDTLWFHFIETACFSFQVTGTLKLRWWIGHDFLPKFYSQQWYNGLKDGENIYVENKMSILVGMPWMRQLRVKRSMRLFVLMKWLCQKAIVAFALQKFS